MFKGFYINLTCESSPLATKWLNSIIMVKENPEEYTAAEMLP